MTKGFLLQFLNEGAEPSEGVMPSCQKGQSRKNSNWNLNSSLFLRVESKE
jgi:hypothetical protein